MSRLSDAQIDEAILSITETRWRKVALAIAKVAQSTGEDASDLETAHKRIAERVEILVRGGGLESAGDIKEWRWSEIRKAT